MRPHISGVFSREGRSVEIDVQNRSAFSVSVTDISILTDWDRRRVNYTSFSPSVGAEPPEIEGPEMPFVINGFHSQTWSLTDSIVELMVDFAQHKMLFQINLSSGKAVYEEVDIRPFRHFTAPEHGRFRFTIKKTPRYRLLPIKTVSKIRSFVSRRSTN